MDIIAMHRNGYSIRKIAKLHGIHRDTVKRHLESNSFPEYQKEKRKISILGPYSQIIKHRDLHLHYLPAYHPELNYQETLWRTMRYEETTNAFFETIETLEVSAFKKSQRWKPQKIKPLCPLI